MAKYRLKYIAELDRALIDAAKPIKVLQHLHWSAHLADEFLTGWRAGRPKLPAVELQPSSYAQEVTALTEIQKRCDRQDPLQDFLAKTAGSYADAARMLENIGRPDFTKYSIKLYGAPDAPWRTQAITGVDAARFFLETTDRLLGSYHVPSVAFDIDAERFAARLRAAIDPFFRDDPVEVVLDDALPSKAIASSRRIRLRSGAMFSELDLAQLVHHEAHVHAATALNGKHQPHLKSLGLGPPRTTRMQEGLAVLSELITLSIDIIRLRRVAVRVLAVKAALDGGDFIDVFRCFLEAGQSEEESYQSAQRVFRGGDVRGRVAYTKDVVYLRGLLEVHTFLRVAIRDNRPEFVSRLFAGRLTLADIVTLAPEFDSGVLVGPRYTPPWAQDLRRLAALIAYSAFVSQITLDNVYLQNFVEFERRQEEAA
ncbi:MAG: flavohemoglobin expression-modulating QEGLA motif protein [Gammaproteobacteria bacterium]|nr:flavohemoglobin expression-modulating QEGLA motif protein [Gammaproteobacteria bacterium]